MQRRFVVLLACALLVTGVMAPAAASAASRTGRASRTGVPTSRATRLGTSTFTLGSALLAGSVAAAGSSTQGYTKLDPPGLPDDLAPGRVGLPFDGARYYWTGAYLHVEGVLYNPYDYAVTDMQVGYKASSAEGVPILEETHPAAGYVLYTDEYASFQGIFYLPQYAGTSLSSCTITRSGIPYVGAPTVILTNTRLSRSVAASGIRVYSIVFRNDSSGWVARTVVGGWEVDANDDFLDSMVNYSDALIPPGGLVTMEASAFYANFTPTDYIVFGEAIPVTVHTLTSTGGPNGSVAPTGTLTVEAGTDTTVQVTPDPGFCVADVTVDGLSVGAVTSYVFADVATDHTLLATFKVLQTKASLPAPVAPSTMRRNHAATIYGYISPYHAPGGTLVTLMFELRNSHGKYVYHNSVKAKGQYYSTSKTKYTASVKLPHAGKWRVRAYHSDAGHLPTYSSYDNITVK